MMDEFTVQEREELAAYRAAGLSPEEVAELVGQMQSACVKCSGKSVEPVFDAKPGELGCPLLSCRIHRWRKVWYREAVIERERASDLV